MKTILLLITCMITTIIHAQEQDNVTLNVRLYPIQSLVVNNSQIVVNLDYKSKDDYRIGVFENQIDHLSIFSTGGFEISVKSSTPNLTNGAKTIPVSDILLTASDGSNALDNAVYIPTNLSNIESTLITSEKGGVDKTFSIEYKAKGDYEYINLYDHNSTNIFTTVVTYSIYSR